MTWLRRNDGSMRGAGGNLAVRKIPKSGGARYDDDRPQPEYREGAILGKRQVSSVEWDPINRKYIYTFEDTTPDPACTIL